jgi:RNA polymerase sigma factor (sigma-70 family)
VQPLGCAQHPDHDSGPHHAIPQHNNTERTRSMNGLVQSPGTTAAALASASGTADIIAISGEYPVVGLVAQARDGEKQAWDALVERYAPLIWSICRRYRLDRADTADVSQTVWLHLVDHMGNLRNPAALPGWLATTTRHECGRVLRAARGPLAAGYDLDAEALPDEQAATVEQELLAAERHMALREAFGDLPAHCQRLIVLLTADPPVPCAEISAWLGMAVGSIGPTRRRCLDKLRQHPAIAALTDTEARTADSEIPDHALAR